MIAHADVLRVADQPSDFTINNASPV